jgi:ribosomal protein L7/L12
MGVEELLLWGLLLAVVLWSSLRVKETVSAADVFRLERKIDYLLIRFEIDPQEAEAVQPSAEVLDLIRAGKKIGAVKALRQEARLTLREAKEIVDRFEAQDRTG